MKSETRWIPTAKVEAKAKPNKIVELVEFALADTTNEHKEINFSTLANYKAQQICESTGVIVNGATRFLNTSGVRHAFANHGDHAKEQVRNQIGIVTADFAHLPAILNEYDSYEKGSCNNRKGQEAVLFIKRIGGKRYHVVMSVVKNKNSRNLVFNTMYIKP